MPAFTIPCLGSWQLCLFLLPWFCAAGRVVPWGTRRWSLSEGARRLLAARRVTNSQCLASGGSRWIYIYIYRWLWLQRAGVLGTGDFNNELPGFIARQVLRFPAEHRQV